MVLGHYLSLSRFSREISSFWRLRRQILESQTSSAHILKYERKQIIVEAGCFGRKQRFLVKSSKAQQKLNDISQPFRLQIKEKMIFI